MWPEKLVEVFILELDMRKASGHHAEVANSSRKLPLEGPEELRIDAQNLAQSQKLWEVECRAQKQQGGRKLLSSASIAARYIVIGHKRISSLIKQLRSMTRHLLYSDEQGNCRSDDSIGELLAITHRTLSKKHGF